jgi:hypothetical protein
MAVGTIGAIFNGASLPAFSILFGELIEVLGNPNSPTYTEDVEKYSIWLALVGILSTITSWWQVNLSPPPLPVAMERSNSSFHLVSWDHRHVFAHWSPM